MNYLHNLNNPFNQTPQFEIHHTNKSRQKKLAIPFLGETHIIKFEEILAVMANDGLTTIILKNGKKLSLEKSLNAFELLLIDHGFMRIHKSYIINMTSIKSISRKNLVVRLEGNMNLPIARRKYENVIEYIQEHLYKL